MKPGRYIFPGAEVYSEPEDYDQYSLSANSESTDSDCDSSSGEEEEDEEEETCESSPSLSSSILDSSQNRNLSV